MPDLPSRRNHGRKKKIAMLSKEQATEWAKKLCEDGAYSAMDAYRQQFPIGSVAESLWSDTTFEFGIEYGLLIAVAKIYGDLENNA